MAVIKKIDVLKIVRKRFMKNENLFFNQGDLQIFRISINEILEDIVGLPCQSIKSTKPEPKKTTKITLIEDLKIEPKLLNLLNRNGIFSIEGLALYSESELKEIKYIGDKHLRNLKAALPKSFKFKRGK